MEKSKILQQIENNVKQCRNCRLCETALNAVPGEGNINAELMFIGEAPGATEDQTGRPFVGRAGKLLDTMLDQIGFKRTDVWIGNIIKHRPPNNRDPLPDEIQACQPYLKLQIETIAPLLIVTLGRFSMNYFYPDGRITRDHGVLKILGNRAIFPVYHPAAALRNGEFFNALKADFVKIPESLDYLRTRKQKGDAKNDTNDSNVQMALDL